MELNEKELGTKLILNEEAQEVGKNLITEIGNELSKFIYVLDEDVGNDSKAMVIAPFPVINKMFFEVVDKFGIDIRSHSTDEDEDPEGEKTPSNELEEELEKE